MEIIEKPKTPETDFSDDEKVKVQNFVNNGCPGLVKIANDEPAIMSMFSLYMSGKNYIEISNITKTKHDIVLYLSHKMKWYEKKMEYLDSIHKGITDKMVQTKIESLNFIAGLISMYHKSYGTAINRYLSTNDPTHLVGMDMKLLTHYFKSMEMFEKLMNPENVRKDGDKDKQPAVTINVASGSSLKQSDDKTLEITTQDNHTGSILRALAQIKEELNKK